MENLHHTNDKWYATRLLISLIIILSITTVALNHSFKTEHEEKGPYGETDPEEDIMNIKREVKVIAEKKVIVVKKKQKKAMTLKVVPDKKELPDEQEITEVTDSNYVVTDDTTLLNDLSEPTTDLPVEHLLNKKKDAPLSWSEIRPEFPGGEKALLKYLKRHMNYPMYEEELGLEGEVVATFVVRSDGSVGSIEIVRTTTAGFAKEANRVLSKMPAWTPGYHNGKAVTVRYSIPVRFKL